MFCFGYDTTALWHPEWVAITLQGEMNGTSGIGTGANGTVWHARQSEGRDCPVLASRGPISNREKRRVIEFLEIELGGPEPLPWLQNTHTY